MASVDDCGDAFKVRLRRSADTIMTSTDLLYAFGRDSERFGRILVVHALSDLFATLAQPLCATLVLGVTHKDVADGRAAAIARSVAGTLVEEGAVLSGGHTALATDTFATLSVVGHAAEVAPEGQVRAGDIVLLGKPLGSGLAISAERFEVACEKDLEVLYATMATSNRSASNALISLRRALGAKENPIRRVTDVSGFGFLDALKQAVGGARVRIAADTVPVGPGVPGFVGAQAWSELLDANVVESAQYTVYEGGVDMGAMQVILNDPQTSGGLLAVTTPEVLDRPDLLEAGSFAVVGTVEESPCPVAVEVAVGPASRG